MNLKDRVSLLVGLWAPRLKVAERITIKIEEIEPADGTGEIECCIVPNMLAEPESAGLWDFLLCVSPDLAADDDTDLERKIVHELVHLIVEPLRETFFTFNQTAPHVERWETVVCRLADAFLSAHS